MRWGTSYVLLTNRLQWHRCQRSVGGSLPQRQRPWLVGLSGRQEAGPRSFSSQCSPVGPDRFHYYLNRSDCDTILSNRRNIHHDIRPARPVLDRAAPAMGRKRWCSHIRHPVHCPRHPGRPPHIGRRLRRPLEAAIRHCLRAALVDSHRWHSSRCVGCGHHLGPGRPGLGGRVVQQDAERRPGWGPRQGRDCSTDRIGDMDSGRSSHFSLGSLSCNHG